MMARVSDLSRSEGGNKRQKIIVSLQFGPQTEKNEKIIKLCMLNKRMKI